MFDFSTLESCKTSILAILNIPKGTDPSGVDYLLVNDWGGYRLGFLDPFGYQKDKKFAILPRLPGCEIGLFNKAAQGLLDEGKIVQYNYAPSFKGVSMQVVAGLADREADFFPKRAA